MPATLVAAFAGTTGVSRLLVLSQVILSLQLPFALVPLVTFTSDAAKMGRFANGRVLKAVSWLITAVIVFLNCFLIVQVVSGNG